jgi:hypothetical protein
MQLGADKSLSGIGLLLILKVFLLGKFAEKGDVIYHKNKKRE